MIDLPGIVGQEQPISRLQRNLAAGRMHHALLFAGPAGVGRRTTAIALGKVLLCENPVKSENREQISGLNHNEPAQLACGVCESCRLFEGGTHPDFHLVYKELARYHEDSSVRNRVMQDLGIPIIRKHVIAPAMRSATKGIGKVFVILETELINSAAQNALLKTLEEPPAGVTIILVCKRPEQLLPTTRSRCALIRFGQLPTDFITSQLATSGIATAEANFWAAFTGGSLGNAQRLSSAGMYDIKRQVISQIANLSQAGDAGLGEKLAKMTDQIAEAHVKLVKKEQDANMSKTLATRQATGTMLQLIASAFSDALKISAGVQVVAINSDQIDDVNLLASKFSPSQLAEIIEQLSEFEKLLWRNLNAKVIWDNVVITCASAAMLRL